MNLPSLTRRACVLSLALAPWGLRAQAAAPAEVSSELPGARLLGSGRLTFFGLHVYDARLWVDRGLQRRPLRPPIRWRWSWSTRARCTAS